MLAMSDVSSVFHRISPSLQLAALGLVAGLSFGISTAVPAAADPVNWPPGCQFKTVPNSGPGEMQHQFCQRLYDCQQMADAAGHTIFGAGCFWVPPRVPASSVRKH